MYIVLQKYVFNFSGDPINHQFYEHTYVCIFIFSQRGCFWRQLRLLLVLLLMKWLFLDSGSSVLVNVMTLQVQVHTWLYIHMYVYCIHEIFGKLWFALKMHLVRFLLGGFEYCMERNPCLQPKWRTDIYMIHWTTKLKPLPNIPRIWCTVHMYVGIVHCVYIICILSTYVILEILVVIIFGKSAL